MKIIYTYLLSVPIIFAFDLFWLGIFAKEFYIKMMSPLVQIKFYWPAVVLFYLLYFVGIFIFALLPGIEANSLTKTLTLAAMFGFFCYMTYDITNLATLKNWPIKLVVIDILWGTTLSTLTAFVAYKIYFWL